MVLLEPQQQQQHVNASVARPVVEQLKLVVRVHPLRIWIDSAVKMKTMRRWSEGSVGDALLMLLNSEW